MPIKAKPKPPKEPKVKKPYVARKSRKGIPDKEPRGPKPERENDLIQSALSLIDPKKKFSTGERETQEAKNLQFQWCMDGGIMTPHGWLLAQGYTSNAASVLLGLSGNAEGWREKRKELQDQVTEKIARRYVDKIAELAEGHLKSSNLVHLKSVEFLTKLSIEPARDKAGKMIMDGKGKPVWRGIRSQDILNAAQAIKESQHIMRKALGISDRDEFGLQQMLTRLEQKNEVHNTQVNININAEGRELAEAVKKLSYDDVVDIIKAKRRKAREIEAKKIEGEDEVED